jgi:hypothetical protein
MATAFICNPPGIGDALQFGGIFENYFRNFNEKAIDLSRCWVFDYNPYARRDYKQEEITEVINLWMLQFPPKDYLSYGERQCEKLGWSKCYLRHPRLYRFEDAEINPKTCVIHTNGRSEGGVMPDKMIDQIAKNYKGWRIFQIGGKEDRETPFERMTDLSLWECAELIASSQVFIGVNSSMMNIANCYPRVHRKVFINRKDTAQYYPVSGRMSSWIDYNFTYITDSEDDEGIAYSYRKI